MFDAYGRSRSADLSPKTVMVIGLGRLGGPVLDLLATRLPGHRFVCVGRNAEALSLRVNLSRYVAAQWESYPEIVPAPCDLLDVDAMAACLCEHNPDVVFNATTPFAWWRIAELPRDAAARAEAAGPGMWSALDCLLPLRLSQAIGRSGIRATYVNACYPDLTNAFLSGLPTAPLLGIGNLSNLVPGLRLAFADESGVPASRIQIRLVAHHYVSLHAPTPGGAMGAPFHLTITLPSGKRTFEGPGDACFGILRARATRTRGIDGLGVTVGSAATVLTALVDGVGGALHSPGALGLPGGYPVRISPTGEVKLDLNEDLALDRAVAINGAAQRFDGTEWVDAGVAVPTDLSREVFGEIVGEPLPDVTLDNVHELARLTVENLNARYDLGLAVL